MKRLAYSPKCYCFIRSNNQSLLQKKSVIYNVTEDVESGSVTRKVGSESSATIVLRNRFKKYTRADDNSMIFMPNDMITIWLQRIAGKPIQQFTGYIDSCPYFQAYPGSATIEATCTLKKLSYTWFDPGLPWFQEWLKRVGGWILNPQTGSITNPKLLVDGAGIVNASNTTAGGTTVSFPGGGTQFSSTHKSTTNDAGFGHLLYEFMVHYANWAPENVIISDLPSDLPDKAAALYKSIDKQAQADLNTLGAALSQLMSVSVVPQDPSSTSSTLSPLQERITKTIKQEADSNNIPAVVPVVAALLASHYKPTFRVTDTTASNWGFGLYALRPTATPSAHGSNQFGTIEGHSEQDLLIPQISTRIFCGRLLAHNFVPPGTPGNQASKVSFLARANQGDTKVIKTWIEATMGRTFTSQYFQEQLDWANRYVSMWNTQNANQQITGNTPPPLTATKHFTWTSPEIVALLNQGDMNTYSSFYKNRIYDSLAPYYWIARTQYGMRLSARLNNDFGQLIVNNPNHYLAFAKDLKGRPEIRSVSVTSIGHRSDVTVTVDKNAPYPTWDGQKPTEVVDPHPPPTPDPTSQRAAISSHGLTIDQVATQSFDSAFFAQTSFGPLNPFLSNSLTGDRALMNDIPVLQAVQQFTQGSMREYMSLPDGKFLAFYPDYFGARRKHYWEIFDIEIVNLGIQLNDYQLATHVYVIGDTFDATGSTSGPSALINMVETRGVATIAQAFMLESFIVPENGKNPDSLGNLKTPYEILKHYGARPLVISNPLIHNTFYEFLMAYQTFMLKWASQFATNVEFTFQPEVMAGGLVQFPDHQLQMYVQEVTHSFDYTNGFSTQAVLTAPATTDPTAKTYPGFAIAGSTLSVGAAAG